MIKFLSFGKNPFQVPKDTVFCSSTLLRKHQNLQSLDQALVMGILNVNPDSFFRFASTSTSTSLRFAQHDPNEVERRDAQHDPNEVERRDAQHDPNEVERRNTQRDSILRAVQGYSIDDLKQRAAEMISEGIDIIDIGGYSTRPGADDVAVEEEINRVIPVIQVVRKAFPDILISVDTFRSGVARLAVEAGADIINDVSGGELDPEMFHTVAELQVPYVLMHMQGTPQTMQNNPMYEDVTLDLIRWFSERIFRLEALGVNDIIIDPGFGFGKTVEHNFQLLSELKKFRLLEKPILAGLSRKSMIYKSLGTTPQEALNGTSILNTIALENGAGILRVHDVKEARECVLLNEKLCK